jgi:hypothetical protein
LERAGLRKYANNVNENACLQILYRRYLLWHLAGAAVSWFKYQSVIRVHVHELLNVVLGNDTRIGSARYIIACIGEQNFHWYKVAKEKEFVTVRFRSPQVLANINSYT